MQKLYSQLSLLVGLSVFRKLYSLLSKPRRISQFILSLNIWQWLLCLMPANAPKGGVLSQAAQGTFDNLNSMNGKGNATEGVNYLLIL